MSAQEKTAHPLPQPTQFTKSFWDACQERKLVARACLDCDFLFLPGGPVCPKCWSQKLGVQPLSGAGEVFSFTVYRRTYHPAMPAPYVVALIALEEGPRLISNIIDCSPEEVRIGMPVQVRFESEEGILLPRFAPLCAVTNDKD